MTIPSILVQLAERTVIPHGGLFVGETESVALADGKLHATSAKVISEIVAHIAVLERIVRHYGSNRTERGEPYPQQMALDNVSETLRVHCLALDNGVRTI